MAGIATLQKCAKVEKELAYAKAATRDNALVETYRYLERAERAMEELTRFLMERKIIEKNTT